MRNVNVKLIVESLYISFEGAVNQFFRNLDHNGYSYSVSYEINKAGEYCAFITYGNGGK